MAVVNTTIVSGGNVSSAFPVPNTALALAVFVPSHAAAWGGVQVQFAASSTGPWGPMWVAGANSANVFYGAGPGWGEVPRPPSGFARVVVSNSTAAVASFQIFSVRH